MQISLNIKHLHRPFDLQDNYIILKIYHNIIQPYYFYSSSKAVSFISGKSSCSEKVISKPIAYLCKVYNLGFLVLPFIRFSIVDCVIPDNVANLLIVLFLSLHNSVNLLFYSK